MKDNYICKVENPIEDYKNHKSNALVPSIVLSLLTILFTIIVFISSNSLIFKIIMVVFCVFVVLLIFTLAFMISPKTKIVITQHKQETLVAYVTNLSGSSYLNLHYKGLKYYKAFNRREDYDVILPPEMENSEIRTNASFDELFSSTVIANIFGMIGWHFKSDNKYAILVQKIEENQVFVIYDLRRNKIAISIE